MSKDRGDARKLQKLRESRSGRRAEVHGPDEACTCPGCWACKGHVVGCTCDIDWDELRESRT